MYISHLIKSRPFVTLLAISVTAFAYVALANITVGAATTHTSQQVTITNINVPTPTVSAGDLMLANITVNGGTSALVTPPTGWTLIQRTDNDVNVSMLTYWKVAGASEPSSFTWTVNNQTTGEGAITPFTGVDASNPIDVVADSTGFGTVATTASITTTGANDVVVSFFGTDLGKNANVTYFSQPTGSTQSYNVTNAPYGPSTASFYTTEATPGTIASISSIINSNKPRNWISQQIALRQPAPSSIAFDSVSQYQYPPSGVQVNTFAHTVSGNNRVLFVALENDDGPNESLVSSVTYDGVAMTKVAYVGPDVSTNSSQYLYVLFNPNLGTHDVVFTLTQAKSVSAVAVSYTGAANTGSAIAGLDDVQTFKNLSESSITGITTPAHVGDWAITTGNGTQSPWLAGANINAVRRPQQIGPQFGDSNGPVTSGVPYSMTWNNVDAVYGDNFQNLMITASLAPAN